MRHKCSKCFSEELERSVWVDMQTDEELPGDTTYFCRNCGALVDIIKIEEDEKATIDPEPTIARIVRKPREDDWGPDY